MAVISSSTETIAVDAAGSWWTPSAASVSICVDNAGRVVLEARRGSTDGAPKPVILGDTAFPQVVSGPCRLRLTAVVGENYRFRNVGPIPAMVAAIE